VRNNKAKESDCTGTTTTYRLLVSGCLDGETTPDVELVTLELFFDNLAVVATPDKPCTLLARRLRGHRWWWW
jgi:hypothetical protein